MEPLDPNLPVLEIPPGLSERPNLDPKLANLPAVPRLDGGNLPTAQPTWELDTVLAKFGPDAPFTSRHACSGVIIFGETGSGKTSGPCKTLLLNYLKRQFGGLVLCVKPEEGSDWVNYAKAAGREKDVIRITADPDCPHRFDFLAWEMSLPGSNTLTTVQTIQNVGDVLRGKEGGGGSNDAFWSANAKKLIKNAVDLYKLSFVWGSILKAQGHLPANEWIPTYKPTILFILELITSAITDSGALDSPSVIEGSLNLKCLRLAHKVAAFHRASKAKESAAIVNTFDLTDSFWRNEWAKDGVGDSRLRDNIIAFAQSTMEPLERGEVANLFQRVWGVDPKDGCEKYLDTVSPEMVDQGKIIIVDVPVNYYHEAGQLAGAIWKNAIHRHLNRRSEHTRQLVEAVKARYSPAIDEAERALFDLGPESPWEQATPDCLKFGPRQRALEALSYAQEKHDQELKRTEDSVRIIFIWVDEYQNFIVRGDVLFQATARSQRAAVVYATQSIASLDDAVGKDMRETLTTNMTTKIACRNTHPATNQWFSDMIGSKFKNVKTEGRTQKNLFDFLLPSLSRSYTKQLVVTMPPAEFTMMKIGGPVNRCKVGGIVIGAEKFKNGEIWIRTTFDQNVGRVKVTVPDKLRAKVKARIRREAR